MMVWFKIAMKSIWSRKIVALLLILAIALSTMTLIGMERLKESAKTGFSNSISGTDLIVGARTGDVQLLMATVFKVGRPIANVSWGSIEKIASSSEVSWVVPISVGDSHEGFPVVGTTNDYFKFYRYGNKREMSFRIGSGFGGDFDAVVGSKVANELGYYLGDTIQLAHGAGDHISHHHDEVFKISGVLNPTGTPIDSSVIIPLMGMEAMHHEGEHYHGATHPKAVTAAFIGLKSKFRIFTMQQKINKWEAEPLMGIVPGIVLAQLWNSLQLLDNILKGLGVLLVSIALLGVMVAFIMLVTHRKQEIVTLRIIGAHPRHIVALIITEVCVITFLGIGLGVTISIMASRLFEPMLTQWMGFTFQETGLSWYEIKWAVIVMVAALITSMFPAWKAYSSSVSKGVHV